MLFLAIFAAEFVLKVINQGLLFIPDAYLRSGLPTFQHLHRKN